MQSLRPSFQYKKQSLRCLYFAISSGLALLSACNPTAIEAPVDGVSYELRDAFDAAQKGQDARISEGWLRTFRSPELSSLVKQALANNPDLRATASQLESARQGTIIGRAARLPTLSANSNANLSLDENFNSNRFFGLSLNAAWELDLWGRLLDLEVATIYDYEGALADYRSARLSLAINVAQSWCNLITAEKQLTLAEQSLDSFNQNYRIIQRGYKLGTLRALDDAFGRSNIEAAEGSLLSRQLDRNEAARTLQLLLGSYPDSELLSVDKLPKIPTIKAGIPAELLARRPDLTSRRLALAASAKRADAARKSLLPDINLTGNSGNSSNDLLQLLDPSNLTESLTASIAQNLFAGGRIRAQARQALANNQVQIDFYHGDVLTALREVESALDADLSLKKQEEHLRREVTNTVLAEKWAESDFVEGLDTGDQPSILEVLEAQRRALTAQITLINLQNQRLQNHLDLILALGGSI